MNHELAKLIGPRRAIIHDVVECVLVAVKTPLPVDDVPPVLLNHGDDEYWPGGKR